MHGIFITSQILTGKDTTGLTLCTIDLERARVIFFILEKTRREALLDLMQANSKGLVQSMKTEDNLDDSNS